MLTGLFHLSINFGLDRLTRTPKSIYRPTERPLPSAIPTPSTSTAPASPGSVRSRTSSISHLGTRTHYGMDRTVPMRRYSSFTGSPAIRSGIASPRGQGRRHLSWDPQGTPIARASSYPVVQTAPANRLEFPDPSPFAPDGLKMRMTSKSRPIQGNSSKLENEDSGYPKEGEPKKVLVLPSRPRVGDGLWTPLTPGLSPAERRVSCSSIRLSPTKARSLAAEPVPPPRTASVRKAPPPLPTPRRRDFRRRVFVSMFGSLEEKVLLNEEKRKGLVTAAVSSKPVYCREESHGRHERVSRVDIEV
jgi:hypothetical protein